MGGWAPYQAIPFFKENAFKYFQPITSPFGTVAEPAMIPSPDKSRIVGCVGGGGIDHEVSYFLLSGPKKHMCQQCGQIFQMQYDPIKTMYEPSFAIQSRKHFFPTSFEGKTDDEIASHAYYQSEKAKGKSDAEINATKTLDQVSEFEIDEQQKAKELTKYLQEADARSKLTGAEAAAAAAEDAKVAEEIKLSIAKDLQNDEVANNKIQLFYTYHKADFEELDRLVAKGANAFKDSDDFQAQELAALAKSIKEDLRLNPEKLPAFKAFLAAEKSKSYAA